MFYIGRTSQPLAKRLEQHMARLKAGKHNKKFQNCYSKYGPESFTIELVQDLNNTDKLEAQTLEEQLISLYWGNKKLLNCSRAGEGGYTTAGYDEDEALEYRAKLSAAKSGDKNPFSGRTHTAETKKAMSDRKQGDKHWRARLTWDQVNQMRKDYTTGQVGYGDLAIQYNFSRTAIARIITGKTWLDPDYTYVPRVIRPEHCKNKVWPRSHPPSF